MNKLKREVGPTCIACYMYSIRALFIIVIKLLSLSSLLIWNGRQLDLDVRTTWTMNKHYRENTNEESTLKANINDLDVGLDARLGDTNGRVKKFLEPPQFSVMCGTELGWRALTATCYYT